MYDGKNWNERGYDETVCKLFHPIDDDHKLKKKKTQQNKKFKNRNSNTHIKIDATEIMKMVQAIPVDTHMYYRCRRITQSLDKKAANDVFVMVLEMLDHTEPFRHHERSTPTPSDGAHECHSHRKGQTQSIRQNTVSQ